MCSSDLGTAAARGGITPGTATSVVPGATQTAPAANYYGGADLGTGTAATLTDCAGPQAAQTPACQAVNFSQTNPGRRPSFTIAPNHPLRTGARAIIADPAAVAGNLAGTYSACTTQTVKAPDLFETRLCNEYRTLEHHSCRKTLSVSVTDNGLNCAYGSFLTPNVQLALIRPYVFVGALCADDIRFQWTWGFSECNGSNDPQFMNTVFPSEDFQVLGASMFCGGFYQLWGRCPNGQCNYAVGSVTDNYVCEQFDYANQVCDGESCYPVCLAYRNEPIYAPLAGFSWQQIGRAHV